MVSEAGAPGVFVSYRRSDSADEAGRIAEALVRRVGRGRVFVDVLTLKAGDDFHERIDDTVSRSGVCLVIIGPSWLNVADPHGLRRLDDRDDVVRAEVAAALRIGRTVIPVLVRDAPMPDSHELPDELRALASRQAASIDDAMWSYDVQRLVSRVEEELETGSRSDAGGYRLVAGTSELIGRDELVLEVERSLDTARLVTLTGAGGSGKTRLAREISDRASGTITVFVDLTGTHDAALVPRAVAMAAGVAEADEGGELSAVSRVLRSEPRAMLVLDNCEHLLDASAAACAELVASTPALAVLTTSRAPLSLEGERLILVPPLAVPGADPSVEIGTVPSVQLFVQRARTVDPSFTLNDSNAQHVASICRQVDGIPLAVELAAARIRGMGVREIAARLGERLDLLASSARGGDRRHRTMVDTLDWSYSLLEHDEARLLDRLSIFSGGFELDAAEAVCAGDGLDVLTALLSLVDRSLVVAETMHGTTRYRLLEPVRQYAARHVSDAGERDDLAASHARFAAELVERAEPLVRGPSQETWKRRLRRETANIRSAVAWSTDHDPDLLGRIVIATWWSFLESVTEVRAWAAQAMELRHAMQGQIQAGVVNSAAHWALFQGDYAEAASLGEEAIALDQGGRILSMAMTVRGSALRELRRLDEAAALHESVAATSPDPWFVARSIYSLGLVELARPDLDAARTRFEESRDRYISIGDRNATLESIGLLAMIAIRSGETDVALALCDEAMHLMDDETGPEDHADVLFSISDARREAGDLHAAREALREAYDLIWSTGFLIALPPILDRAAAVELAGGDASLAITLLGACDRLRGGAGSLEGTAEASRVHLFSGDIVAKTRDGALAVLTPDAADAAWRRGLSIDLDGIPALIAQALPAGVPSPTGETSSG